MSLPDPGWGDAGAELRIAFSPLFSSSGAAVPLGAAPGLGTSLVYLCLSELFPLVSVSSQQDEVLVALETRCLILQSELSVRALAGTAAPECCSAGKPESLWLHPQHFKHSEPLPDPDMNDTISWKALFLAADEQRGRGCETS